MSVAPSSDNSGLRPRRAGWWRFLQFRLRTLLLLTLVAAIAMFFYSRPEVVEEQPMPGYHLKRQVYRTADGTPVNQGWWELRDDAQHVVCEGRYRHDQPSGEWVWRHPNGRVKQQGEYRQGKRHGLWKTWYDDGRPREEFTYADGTLQGTARSWWPGGQLASQGAYAVGQRSGQWTFYDEAGQQTAAGAYEEDQREGAWLAWDDAGGELPTRHYAAGQLVPEDQALLAAWRQRLESPGFAKRAEAAWALSRLGDEGLAALDAAAGSSDADVRSLAIVELAKRPQWAANKVPRLVKALDEKSPQVQLAAMGALSALGARAQPAVAKLEGLLQEDQAREGPGEKSGGNKNGDEPPSNDDNFQAAVLATLVSIVPDRDDLVARFVRAYPKHAVYEEAYDEVTRCLARSAQPGLLKAVKSPDAKIRTAALATLGSALRAGRFPASASAMQTFAEALQDGDAQVRREACDAIGAFGLQAKDLKPQLQAAANDPDAEVAKAAQNAIQLLDGAGGRSGGFGGAGFF